MLKKKDVFYALDSMTYLKIVFRILKKEACICFCLSHLYKILLHGVEKVRNKYGKEEHHNKGLYVRTGAFCRLLQLLSV